MTSPNQSINKQNLPHKKFFHSEFLAFSVAMMVILSIVALLPLIPNDFFPFLRIGDEIIRTGHIPTTEFMTFTQFGKPADYFYWLFSLMFFEIYELGGVTLTAVFSMLCIGGYYSLLWLCLRELKTGLIPTILILMLIAQVGALFFPMRPQLLAYPLFGFALLVIIRWQKGENRFLWLLPLIALLWANIHGSFIVFFFVLFPALIFGSGNRKRLALFTFISLISTLVNYYGFKVWTNIFSMVNNQSIRIYIDEWKPPVNQGWQLNLFFLGFLLIPVLTAFAKPKIKIVCWIWYLGFGWMALTSVRYLIWFLPFEALLLSMLINPFFDKLLGNSSRFKNRTLNVVIGVCFLILPLTLLPGVREHWLQQSPPVFDDTIPRDATIWLKENPQLPDNLWCDFNYASYFTYELPQRKMFMSNRVEDLSIDLIEDYNHISQATYNWQSLLEKYDINMVIPSVQEQPDLIEALSSAPDWKEIYRDQQAVIFLRN
ncbi:hypothetical protein JW964_02210 [candidate division KSB1 bacterium]|nr:hypothetical protein [candidate division KSB1 bacterium]